MRALFMLLLGYTAYRMALRIRDENSSRLLLTDQRPDAPQAEPAASPSRSRNSRTTATEAAAPRQRKRR